jgi:hypothetical protein
MLRKNTAANFWMLLAGGQRVDWQYSLIMILIIGGLICTPLILGSIRDRAYQVHKREVEITNNAREILITSSGERSKAQFDDDFVARLAAAEPQAAVLGNFRVAITPQGPKGASLVGSAQALVRGDPRIDVFDVESASPDGLDIRDLVLSEGLGRRLYGAEAWNTAWPDGRFTGPPLRLNYADSWLAGDFQVVGRQKRGEGMFFSPLLGVELRSISDGLGSSELAIPPKTELVAVSLPKLRTGMCVLRMPKTDICPEEVRQGLDLDLRSRQHGIAEGSLIDGFLPAEEGASLTVNMVEMRELPGETVFQPAAANCADVIGPILANRCQQATFMQLVTASVKLRQAGTDEEAANVELLGLSPEMFALMMPRLGIEPGGAPRIMPKSLETSGAIQLIAPASAGLNPDTPYQIETAGVTFPARVPALYPCKAGCRIFTDLESAFRLNNLAEGLIEVASTDPLILRPKRSKIQYDEVLVYPSTVEEVLDLSKRLEARLGKDYTVQPKYNIINNLKRDNARLSAVFLVTLVFAIVFLLLSLSALSKINVDRRNRQMAQLLILGVSRWFVRLLVLFEYLFITALAALFALGVSAFLCYGLRTLILGGYLGEMPNDASFQRVVNAMEIDPVMFGELSAVVIVCSFVVAAVVAMYASKANPIELLD